MMETVSETQKLLNKISLPVKVSLHTVTAKAPNPIKLNKIIPLRSVTNTIYFLENHS